MSEMLDDLNDLLGRHSRGEDTETRFAAVHGETRRLLPGAAANMDELIDSLARRPPRASGCMRSLSARSSEELAGSSGRRSATAAGGGDGGSATTCARCGPISTGAWRAACAAAATSGTARPPAPGGDRRPGRPARPAGPGASRAPLWTTSTSRRSSATSAGIAADDVRRLQELEREMRRQGWVTRGSERSHPQPEGAAAARPDRAAAGFRGSGPRSAAASTTCPTRAPRAR
jgi:hypothetical protein